MGNRQTSSLAFVAAATLGLVAFAPTSGCSSKTNQGAAESGDSGSGSSSGGIVGFGDQGDSSAIDVKPAISDSCPFRLESRRIFENPAAENEC